MGYKSLYVDAFRFPPHMRSVIAALLPLYSSALYFISWGLSKENQKDIQRALAGGINARQNSREFILDTDKIML